MGILALAVMTGNVQGGGSGLNVVVVVNQASTNSVRLGNYYCERRQVPPQNVLRINWPGSRTQWTPAEFSSYLATPLSNMIAARQLTNQADYVLLSMDIPYRVKDTTGANSTTSALFYGFKPDGPYASWYLAAGSSNSYAGSEGVFRATPPGLGTGPWFLAMMLTASNLPLAQMVVDQGATSDGTFPSAPACLAKSTDRLRNIRYALFDDALFDTRLLGGYSLQQTNTNTSVGLGPLLGYQNGTQVFAVVTNTFVPGAMADSLTSFGGYLFEPNDHTTLLPLLAAGASGSYGTIVEPANWLQKFPAPRNYFYQARGFSLAECYYQSVTNPYQGLLVGEPLAAPFARAGQAAWLSLPAGARLSGTTNLSVRFVAADVRHPLQAVDLFVDGLFLRTLTNIPPQFRNTVDVLLNGQTVSYSVLPGSSLKDVASGVATALNLKSGTTRVRAFAHGDRVELRGMDVGTLGAALPLSANTSASPGTPLTTYAAASGAGLLDTAAQGVRSYTITNIPALGDYLQMVVVKTNGETVLVSVTNTVSGTTLAVLAKSLFDTVSNTPALQGPDGVLVEEINMHEDYPYNIYIYGTDDHSGEFNIRARGPGWARSQARVCLRGSSSFGIAPSGTNTLDENVTDLQPRGHIYLTAGVTNLALSFALDTTALADGTHELLAVGYEGSHVRTQTRVSQTVEVQNTGLAAAFDVLAGTATNLLGTTLRFGVAPNTGAVSKIELFSTGGVLGTVSAQPNATFDVATAGLGIGLHPFYAVVTAQTGKQFRTETKWMRIIDPATPEAPFRAVLGGLPPVLSWPATFGRTYEVQGTADLAVGFRGLATVAPTNSPATWADPSPSSGSQLYRIRVE